MNNYNDKELLELISYNIRKYRKEKGYTQKKLADEIKMSPDYLRRLETQSGREGLSIKRLYRISKVLDVDISKFFQDK